MLTKAENYTKKAAQIRAHIKIEKIARYESFVNEGLRKDLKDALDARDAIYDQISEYLKLAKDIEIIKDNELTEMKTQVDLGSNFYVQAK
ncbi:hypothetical protein BGZ46_005821, partial [Entomortierella lignicola]